MLSLYISIESNMTFVHAGISIGSISSDKSVSDVTITGNTVTNRLVLFTSSYSWISHDPNVS